jgi:hypothetical protein
MPPAKPARQTLQRFDFILNRSLPLPSVEREQRSTLFQRNVETLQATENARAGLRPGR